MASREKTFTSFTAEQAGAYATNRGRAYPKELYARILEYHSGDREVLLDVGTGPGQVVFDLLPCFSRGIGCDAGPEMIEQAKKRAANMGVGDKSRFEVCEAEHCADVVQNEGGVDLLTVAMAAHWFEMPAFYESTAKALKPGGTLAMWTCSSMFVHPSMPRHGEMQEILFDLERNMLRPYAAPGNLISQGAYEDLQLPWNYNTPETKHLFDQTAFERQDWDRGGVPSAPSLECGTPGPFLLSNEAGVDHFVAVLGSASQVVRWRQANPEKAHGEEDPINITAKRLRAVTGGLEKVVGAPSCSLLLMKRAEEK